jgi:imidazolonepropionase-like amidohydrolase
VGSIRAGKYADIIAVEGDGLADLRSFTKVGFVMKGGVVYKGGDQRLTTDDGEATK